MFNPKLARACCLRSNLAYDPGVIRVGSLAFSVYEEPDSITVAIQGTDDIGDFVKDVEARLETHPLLEGFGLVHDGFADALEEIGPEVSKRIPSGKAVVLTGHSLGAAIAQLLAVYLTKRGHNVTSVYCFGCPRIGNATWVSRYDSLGIETYEFVHGMDLVTHVPGFAMYGGKRVYLDQYGRVIEKELPRAWWPPSRWFPNIGWHSIDGYLVALDKLAG